MGEANLTRYDIWVCDELFLTGTAAEIAPIVEVDTRPIGDGKPGQLTAFFRILSSQNKRMVRLFESVFNKTSPRIVISIAAKFI